MIGVHLDGLGMPYAHASLIARDGMEMLTPYDTAGEVARVYQVVFQPTLALVELAAMRTLSLIRRNDQRFVEN